MEALLSHMGKANVLFELLDDYLTNELKAENDMYFDVHDKGWAIRYRVKKKYVCNIVAEKDSFLFVTSLSEEDIKRLYETGIPHAGECIDNSPFRHRGWIEYRVIDAKNAKEAKTILHIRISGKKSVGG